MTPQEQQLIDGLIDRIRSTPVADKDDDADRYIHRALDTTPDALYVLAQTVLVQQYGLNNAQEQIADLQAQLEDAQAQIEQLQAQQKKGGSFLGKLLGNDPQPQQPPAYQPVNTGYPPPPPYGGPAYGQPPLYGQQPYGQPAYGQQPGGSGSFLSGALQTAAGVAAGAMLFEGMESLFHGFGASEHEHERGFDQPQEPAQRDSAASDDSNFYNPHDDASRQGLDVNDQERSNFLGDDNGDGAYDENTSDFSDGGDYDDDSGSSDDSGF